MIELIELRKESAKPQKNNKNRNMLKKTTTQKDSRVINLAASD